MAISHLPKEKEPAAAATATSSKEFIPYEDNTIEKPKSQALTGIEIIGLLEGFVDNRIGKEGVITSLVANQNKAELRFECGGEPYMISFQKCFRVGEF